jgi:hypothetical protein
VAGGAELGVEWRGPPKKGCTDRERA